MRPEDLKIVYEDNHLLAINKPAGIPTQGSGPGESSLVQVAKQYIKSRYNKPGSVYLGVVSRLDAAVTGIVIFARTSKAAARLNDAFANSDGLRKVYWAIIEERPQPAAGECRDWLFHDDAAHRVRVVPEGTPQSKQAVLRYKTLRSLRDGTLLEVELQTGRKHQIRVQLSSRGWPILGDRKYGSTRHWPAGIALHARVLEIEHPVRRTPLSLTAALPRAWHSLGLHE